MKLGTSYHSEEMVDVRTFAKDKPVVFVIGAMAHGKVEFFSMNDYHNLNCKHDVIATVR